MIKNVPVHWSACKVPFNFVCISAPSRGYADRFIFCLLTVENAAPDTTRKPLFHFVTQYIKPHQHRPKPGLSHSVLVLLCLLATFKWYSLNQFSLLSNSATYTHRQGPANICSHITTQPCILFGYFLYFVDRASRRMLVNNQPDALFSKCIYSYFYTSTCFEQQVLIIRRANLY